LGFGAPPGRDALVIAAEQHVGNGTALPFARTGIVRIFEQALFEAFFVPRGLFAHDAGQKPNAGFDHDHRGNLAAGKDEIADRYLVEAARFGDALVDPFETAADDDEPL